MTGRIVKKVTIRSLILILLLSLVFLIVFKKPEAIIRGFVFSGLISILSFHIMKLTFTNAVEMTPDKAMTYAQRQYALRFLIYFVVLYIGLKVEFINFIAVAGGLFTVKAVILLSTLLDKKFLE